MCGIAGILNIDSRYPAERSVRAMCRAISHRGPDGEGFYRSDRGETAPQIDLGHRRLAILDLSEAGRQPLSDESGRYWITYNGEVYNFLELRRELESLGVRFRTETDTEVILLAYRQWGDAFQLKLNGMWAFAIWDEQEKSLFLSRDRFGIKPLFYLDERSRFVFASELKAFRALEGFTLLENETAFRRVLTSPALLESREDTLFAGVKRLPGGHSILVRDGKARISRWWNTLDHIPAAPRSLSDQAESFRELFIDSCRLRLRSDVPVATCLSGGLDSSAVLCTLARIAGDAGAMHDRETPNWQRAFVATFPGSSSDEERFARLAVEHAGADPRYRPIDGRMTVEEIERVVYDFEEIGTNFPSAIWSIYRELRREGVVVSLDGHGADELLGGYTHYAQTALRATGGLLAHPLRTLDMISTLRALYDPSGPIAAPPAWKLLLANDPLIRRMRGLDSRKSDLSQTKRDPVEEAEIDRLGPLNSLLYRDFHRNMLPSILRNFDRCSMAHGIEVRMPFMDWRLVCFAFSLPAESKIGGGYTKRILREAMRGILPEPLRTRRGKIGFNSPLPDWFNGPLREWVRHQVNDPDFLKSPYWNGHSWRKIVESKRSALWYWPECEELWPYLHAHLWRKIFLAPDSSARDFYR